MTGRKQWLWAGAALSAMAVASPAFAQGAAPPTPAGAQPSADTRAQGERDAGEIIVTARRFSERLQDVPGAVTVIGGEDLRRQDLTGFRDIATKVPGFSFETLSPAIVQPSIRGQTNLRVDSPVQNVAFYIDGVYLQRGYLVDQRLVELDRIEVIKGPQSALYGRNAFAGAVNMISRTPSLTGWNGAVTGVVGSDQRFDGRGWISIPVIRDKLAVLLSANYSAFDGTWRNNHPLRDDPDASSRGKLGGWENESYQARVLFTPTPSLTFDALYVRTFRREDALPTYTVSTTGTFNSFNSLNASPRPSLAPPFASENRLFVGELTPDVIIGAGDTRLPGLLVDPRAIGLRGPTDLASAKATFDPDGPLSATYQFGYSKAAIAQRGSVANNPLRPLVLFGFNYGTIFDSSGSGSSFEGFSHDLRVDYDGGRRLRAFAGFNYSTTTDLASNLTEFGPTARIDGISQTSAFPVGPGLAFPLFNVFRPADNPQALLQRLSFYQRDEDIYSPYLFVSFRPWDPLEVTLEARYTWEKHRGRDFLIREGTIGPTPFAPIPRPEFLLQAQSPARIAAGLFKETVEYFTPRATLTYSITRDNNVYFSAGRGVKAGNFNQGFLAASQATYDSEDNWTYEIGSKNQFGSLIVNVAGFYTDWNDLQTGVVRLNANGLPPASFAGSVPSQVGNLKGVEVYGAEMEAVWRATRNLTFNVGAAYNASRYKDGTVSQRFGAAGNCNGTVCSYTTAPGVPYPVLDISGNNLERVPDFNGLAGVSWDGQLGANPEDRYFLRGDVTYKSKQFMDEANLSFVPERTLVNASAGVNLGAVSLQVWAKNLFDEKYVSTAFFLIGTNGALSASYTPVLGERRTVGVTAGARF